MVSTNPPSMFRLLVWSAVSLAMTLLVPVERIHAQTPRIQGQATAAAGMGNAFVAQADDASALHYNPAGMTQLRGSLMTVWEEMLPPLPDGLAEETLQVAVDALRDLAEPR